MLGQGATTVQLCRGNDTESKFVLTRESLLEVNEGLNFANRDLFSPHKVRLLPLVKKLDTISSQYFYRPTPV